MPRMKAFSSLALLLGLCLALLTPPRAQAELEVSFDYFYDALAPYGTWVEVEGYGPCWSPSEVDADWAPYTEGQWVYTDAGWTWVGDEVFAGIVYHYGRWIFTNNQGWCWVPGYEWGPGWVSWRDNDEYIGWAPLPPEVVWEPDQGVGIWVDEVYEIGPSYYSVCHHRDFGHRHLRTVIMARSWNTSIIVQTVNITNITYNRTSGVAYCGGLNYDRACRFTGVTIPALRLERRHDFELRSDHRRSLLPTGQIQGDILAVVAPRIVKPADRHQHAPETTKVIGQNQVQRGWTGKGASGDLDSVRHKMREEVEGRTPKTAPARAISQSDLRFIPERPGKTDQPLPRAGQLGTPVLPEQIKRGIATQPIPAQPPVQGPGRNTDSIPFNPISSPPGNGSVNQRQGMTETNNGPSPIEAYQQRQRAENQARNQAEKERMREMLTRQQNAAVEDGRQKAQFQQQRQEAMESQRQATFQQQQQQAGMERRRQAAIQEQQNAAMDRQRRESAQMQAAAARQQEAVIERRRQAAIQEQQNAAMDRQRQERAQMQIQQQWEQAASTARERQRQSEMQRNSTPPPVSQPPIQTPPNRDSVRRSDDNDDRRKRR